MAENWSSYLKKIMARESLTPTECQQLMTGWLQGTVPPELSGAILTAYEMRGIYAKELAAMAEVLVNQSLGQEYQRPDLPVLLDTCGTGGDGASTFNISTAVAFVAASAGVPVAKHGNRAVSSRSGSADVLEALGLNLSTDMNKIVAALSGVGITFLFAPHWHPAMKAIAPIRKSLAMRTIFNILGPLVNPLRPTAQVIGVYSSGLVVTVAEALRLLGRKRALCVHSRDGLDEISLAPATDGAKVEDNCVIQILIEPTVDFGIATAPVSALQGGDVPTNAEILRNVLQGKGTTSQEDCVAINSGFALYTAGKCSTPAEGINLAREILKSGAGWDKLQALKHFLATGTSLT